MDWPQTKSWRIDFDYERLLNAESAPSSGKYAAGKQGGMQNEAHAPPPPCTREHANAHTHKKIEKYTVYGTENAHAHTRNEESTPIAMPRKRGEEKWRNRKIKKKDK